MYCSLCGEVIDPEDTLSEDMCDNCSRITGNDEEIFENNELFED